MLTWVADGTPRTRGSMLAIIDPHLPMVPTFLINFVLRVLSPWVYSAMKKLLTNIFSDPSNEFPKRVARKTELYGLVRQRVAEFMPLLLAEEAAARAGT